MKNNQTISFDLLRSRLFYSQNREDLILLAFFPDEPTGFYVDVGAYDPDYDSVTKLFYLKGWHGINIEPQFDRFKLFEKKRKRDINLNVGVSNKNGSLTLRSYKNQGLSTFSQGMKDGYQSNGDEGASNFKDLKVEVSTLANIFAKFNVSQLDFLKIDVEGLEYEAIKGNNWEKYRPKVLCIEANHTVKNWRKLIIKADYEFVFFDGLNEYYADKNTDKKAKFDYVKHVVIERGGGLAYEDFVLIDSLYEENMLQVDMLASAEKELLLKNDKIELVNKQLMDKNSVKQVGSQLIRLIGIRLKILKS